jgi:hypothetical protein
VADSFSDVVGGDEAWTTMVAEALTLGAFVAEAVAVFLSVSVVLQLALVALEMWTEAEPPGARLP